MTRCVVLAAVAAVLAIYAPAGADIQRRALATEVAAKLALADGKALPCQVRAWSGEGLEGSCGTIRWEELKPGTAFRILKELAAVDPAAAPERASPAQDLPAERRQAHEDAAAVAMSLLEPGASSTTILDWARKAGVDSSAEPRLKAEADRLRAQRASRRRAELDAALARRTPEAGPFPTQPWITPPQGDIDVGSRAALEAARSLLAKAGGSATLHEAHSIAVLAESGDDSYRAEAAALESGTQETRARFEAAGLPLEQQARIPIVFVTDRDRWRLLVASAFGGDASQHPASVTVYPEGRAVVLVAPEGDPQRRRFAAMVGVARALLHYTGTPQRPAAWINEGLPLALADLAVPGAGRDAELRRDGLRYLRGGGSLAPLMRAGYADREWTRDAALAQSLAYMLVRWMYERNPDAMMRFAKGDLAAVSGDDARYRRVFGEPLEAGLARAQRWFQTND